MITQFVQKNHLNFIDQFKNSTQIKRIIRRLAEMRLRSVYTDILKNNPRRAANPVANIELINKFLESWRLRG